MSPSHLAVMDLGDLPLNLYFSGKLEELVIAPCKEPVYSVSEN